MSATCMCKCVTVNSGGLSVRGEESASLWALLSWGVWRATLSWAWWKWAAARHLILSSASEGAPCKMVRVCDSLIGSRVPLLRVWYSAALEGDCLLSCLLSGIIRAGGCGSGIASNNNMQGPAQRHHLVPKWKLTITINKQQPSPFQDTGKN